MNGINKEYEKIVRVYVCVVGGGGGGVGAGVLSQPLILFTTYQTKPLRKYRQRCETRTVCDVIVPTNCTRFACRNEVPSI